MRIRFASGALIGALAVLAAGCGGDEPDPPSAPGGTEQQPGGDDFDYSEVFDPAPANISDDGSTGDYDCADQDITIDANDVVVFLHGTCRSVTIDGNGNSVSIGTATDVIVNGDTANVSVTDDVTNITIDGDFSEVRYSGNPTTIVNGSNSNARPH